MKRFKISAVFTLPLVILSMFDMILDKWIPSSFNAWIQFFLSTPTILYGAAPLFKRGIDSIKHLSPNMFTLISIGIAISYGYSTLLLFQSVFAHLLNPIQVYFESASTIVCLVLLGQVLEERTRKHSGKMISSLLTLIPETSTKIEGDSEIRISTSELQVGDHVRVFPGEKVSTDGMILHGSTSIDESFLTGESIPILKKVGDSVVGGSLNCDGSIVIKVLESPKTMLLSKMASLIEVACKTKVPLQRLTDQVSSVFIPLVIFTSLLSGLYWFINAPEPRLAFSLNIVVSILLVACPCSLGLAAPMALSFAVSRGAGYGLLIKNPQSFEVLNQINVIVLDKTGTLTQGNIRVSDIKVVSPSWNESKILEYGTALSLHSNHPFSRGILEKAKTTAMMNQREVKNFKMIPGLGITGEVDKLKVSLSRENHLLVTSSKWKEKLELSRKNAETISYLSVNDEVVGWFSFIDSLREEALSVIQTLKNMNLKIVLLSGDNRRTAEAIARQVGIDHVLAEVLPQDKALEVKKLQALGKKVAMVGDGVNDAPALNASDLSFAMGEGTDVAKLSASIVLLKNGLLGIQRAFMLGRITRNIIKQNLFFAFFYNVVAVLIAAGVFYRSFGLLLHPMVASLAMSLSSVSVMLNSIRGRSFKIGPR